MQYDDGVNTVDNVMDAGTPVVRIPVSADDGWGWGSVVGGISGAGAQNMVLTERSLWALVKNSSGKSDPGEKHHTLTRLRSLGNADDIVEMEHRSDLVCNRGERTWYRVETTTDNAKLLVYAIGNQW